MPDSLSSRLGAWANALGRKRLSRSQIEESLQQVRTALLEADVALDVVRDFIERCRVRVDGVEVTQGLTPGQQVIALVQRELQLLLGDEAVELNLRVRPPAVIMLVGLQGAGKTTTAARLARLVSTEHKKRVVLASSDINRPAAVQQLQTLAQQLDIPCLAPEGRRTAAIAKGFLKGARKLAAEVLIVDTAGRLGIDREMMDEVSRLHKELQPVEVLFVIDAMLGQDAARSAAAFSEQLPLSGVVVTKTDGDTRGGAALSARAISGAPIKYLGTGERVEDLEAFHPDRLAMRILGMGDMRTLEEQAQKLGDQKKLKSGAQRLTRGGFDFNDLSAQLQQVQNLGGLESLMDKMPANLQAMMPASAPNPQGIRHMQALIGSMTEDERSRPELIQGSRKRRIAQGAGLDIPALNRLLKQLKNMQKMGRKMKGLRAGL